jgi:hypothetical protein
MAPPKDKVERGWAQFKITPLTATHYFHYEIFRFPQSAKI